MSSLRFLVRRVISRFPCAPFCDNVNEQVIIEFSRTNGAPPELRITEYVGLSDVSLRQVTKAVDSVVYVGQGR